MRSYLDWTIFHDSSAPNSIKGERYGNILITSFQDNPRNFIFNMAVFKIKNMRAFLTMNFTVFLFDIIVIILWVIYSRQEQKKLYIIDISSTYLLYARHIFSIYNFH